MDVFFNTIYYWTNSLYGENLDNYMYSPVSRYVHVGLIMITVSILCGFIYYYLLKPVRHQMSIWLGTLGANALINFIVALCYTYTPIVNNEIEESASWTLLDSVGFGISNVIWSAVAFVVVSLVIKWWSPAKYVPFKKF